MTFNILLKIGQLLLAITAALCVGGFLFTLWIYRDISAEVFEAGER